ncbi:tyrosine-type recombinase/integrase [Weissella cibaria]|uniref:site-specific integrase n=1 Tax=Weissella cibaria TaxID=137591 RepID=UPI0011946878|nr:tyrosine-type recombinase/integrase [Weissella cibaria]TVV19211.1 tyrosine-type recombinase/integrase [Weissella cibaria]
MSVYKADKGWRATYSFKDPSGKYRRKSKQGFRTKKEAETWLAEYSVTNGKPTLKKGTLTLFSDYFDEYQQLRFGAGLKETTRESWHAVQKFVVDVYFNNTTLDQITRQKYQAFLNDYSKGMKRKSVLKRHQIVKQVLTQAFHDGLIPADPTFGVIVPGAESKPADEKFLQIDEFNKLLNYIETNDKLIKWNTSFMIYLIALSGLRAGEALALTRDDVDVNTHTISVTKTKQRSGVSTSPKTKSSIRTIAMPERFFDNYAKFINKKPKWNDGNELFDGRRWATINNNWLERIERELGFENIVSVHGLRHSHVSYLLSKGVDINYASKRLGHSNVTITQEIYAHLLRDKQQSEETKTLSILDEII